MAGDEGGQERWDSEEGCKRREGGRIKKGSERERKNVEKGERGDGEMEKWRKGEMKRLKNYVKLMHLIKN